MNKTKQTNRGQQEGRKQNSKAKKIQPPAPVGPQMPIEPAIALQRVMTASLSDVNPADILALQRTVGNQAVTQLLANRGYRPNSPPLLPDRKNSVQRAPGLPNKAELRGEGLAPGFLGKAWKNLEDALDNYRALDDTDYQAQLTAITNIEGIIKGWWDSHVNSEGVAKKTKEQPKVDKIKKLRGLLKIRKLAIKNRPTQPMPLPPQTPTITPTTTITPPTTTITPPRTIPNTSPPPTVVSRPVSPWESATLTANPALHTKHQGQKTYIKAGQTFATVENGVIGSTTTSFEGGAAEVTVQSQRVKQTYIIPANKTFASIENRAIGSATKYYSSDVEVTMQREFTHQGQAGTVVTYGDKIIWVPEGNLQTRSEPGSLVTYNGTTYWVPQDHLETRSAEWTDKTTTPLFPEGGPKAEHILQGALGDCYLMAALSSIVRTDSAFPERELLKENTDHTVTVKLYDVTQSSNHTYASGENAGEYASQGFACTPKYVKVNKSVPQLAGKDLYAQNNLWVQIVQKAYAAGGFKGNLLAPRKTTKDSYENMESGSSKYAFEVLTGQEASITKLDTKKEHLGITDATTAVHGKIRTALAGRKAVTAGTRSFTEEEKEQARSEGVGHSAGEAKLRGIVADHAYSVVEVRGTNVIKLRNPWGEYGRQLNGTVVPKGDGMVELYMTDFFKWFSDLHISGQIVPISDR